MWLRVIDARQALTARHYQGGGAVTITVNDPLLQNNSARFSIAADGAAKTDTPPALHVDIEGLGAVLLGGATRRGLAVPEAPYAGFYF